MRLRHALPRLGRLALAVGTATVLATGLATNAQAASGSIRYFDGPGNEFDIVNPPDNVCLTLQIRAINVTNETDKRVSVYLGRNCERFITTLVPGRGVSYVGGPQSVRVIG